MKIESIVACGAAKNGYSPDKIRQILLHDPALVKIKECSGDVAAQNYLKIALWFADYQMRSRQQSYQVNYYHQHKQQRGFEL